MAHIVELTREQMPEGFEPICIELYKVDLVCPRCEKILGEQWSVYIADIEAEEVCEECQISDIETDW